MSTRIVLSLTSILCTTAVACDNDDGDGNGGPLTQCVLNYESPSSGGKEFGAACTQDSECKFGECMLPNDTGNITNTKFGFCTRGCDCENADAAKIPDELKEGVLECLYPSDGGGGLKEYHHVVLECNDVSECQAIDSGWTDCRLPDTGSARKVCHAE
ncbi:MAG: hypothetical protein IT385_07010 [Deltaproteobacteria bacterium]|nr:hypothetical protein [Deltaproteobacteria bacterium]